jgi:hypothetical protein
MVARLFCIGSGAWRGVAGVDGSDLGPWAWAGLDPQAILILVIPDLQLSWARPAARGRLGRHY